MIKYQGIKEFLLSRNQYERVFAGPQHPENDLYFYHTDHLGSSAWITDHLGRGIQHFLYLPFGEPWVDQQNSGFHTYFTFSGKERDVETGYGYFGARYYSSDLSIWLSVDPMAGKYPHHSPYVYCADNPIKLIDPNGMDWYTADENGNISLFKKNNDQTDHLVSLNRKGEVRLDKNGQPKTTGFLGKKLSQEVSKGVLSGMQKDSEGSLLDFKGNGSEAMGVFNFLADNTNVEWAVVGFQENDEAQFQVGSSHHSTKEEKMTDISYKKGNEGNLLFHVHSHPYIGSEGAMQGAIGGSPSQGKDTKFWNDILKNSPNAKLGIRFRGHTIYHHNGRR